MFFWGGSSCSKLHVRMSMSSSRSDTRLTGPCKALRSHYGKSAASGREEANSTTELVKAKGRRAASAMASAALGTLFFSCTCRGIGRCHGRAYDRAPPQHEVDDSRHDQTAVGLETMPRRIP